MFRNVIAVIIGIIAGMALNMGILQVSYLAYPIPEGLDINDPAQLQDYLDTLPATAFLVAMLAHLAQSFGGAWVAARLGSSRPMLLAMIVGALSLAGGVMMMTMVKGPAWMALELPLYLVVAWIAGRMEQKRRATDDGPTMEPAQTGKAESEEVGSIASPPAMPAEND
jgi:hypothetical protein